MKRCRSCRAPILWVRTERGRKMPLDAEPYTGDEQRGLFVIRWQSLADPVAIAVPPAAFEGEHLYRSHFSTCPQASQHRRRERAT